MTNPEHMVFRPSIGPPPAAAAKTRAREERDLTKAGGRRGVLGRMARRKALRKLRKRRRHRRARAKSLAAARKGAAGVGRGLVRSGARFGVRAGLTGARAAATGAGGLVGGLVVTAVTVKVLTEVIKSRLEYGKPFEAAGDELEKMLLGDFPEEARATMATRRQISGDPHMSRVAGMEGGRPNSQIASVFDDLKKVNRRAQVGKTALKREFPANGVYDMLILRGYEAFLRVWKAHGLDEKLFKIRDDYKELKKSGGSGR